MTPEEQVGLIKKLRASDRINPEQENALLEMSSLRELQDDDIAKLVSMNEQPEELTTAQRMGRMAVRGGAAVLGFPGDLARIGTMVTPAVPGAATVAKNLSGTEEFIKGIENLTGKSLQAPSDPNFLEKATETGVMGLVGGAPSIVRKGLTAGVMPAAREALSNVSGSVAAQGGAEIAGIPGAIGAMGALPVAKYTTQRLLRGGWRPFDEKQRLLNDSMLARADSNVADKPSEPGMKSFSTATPGGLARRLQSALESIPGSHGYLQEYGQKVNTVVSKRLQKLVGINPEMVSATLEEQAGRALMNGINTRVRSISAQSTKNYELAASLIGDTTKPVAWENSRKVMEDASNQAMSELERRMAKPSVGPTGFLAADAAEAELKKFTEVSAEGGNSYRAMDALRKSIGARMSSKELIGDGELSGFYKKLYGALSDDMAAAAKTLGGPEAAEAVRLAKVYWKAERNITDKVLQKIANKGPEWEQVFRSVMNKELTNTSKMRALMKYSTDDEKRVIAQAWIAKLGRLPDQGGEVADWHVGQFVKNWDRSSEAGRKILLSGDPAFEKDMTQFVASMQDIAKGGGLMANPSGTAAKGLAAATIYYGLTAMSGAAIGSEQGAGEAAAGTILGAAGGAMAANGAARLLTNRMFVKWAMTASKASPRMLPVYIGRLAAIADQEGDPVIVNDIDTFVAAITGAAKQAREKTRVEAPRKLRVGNE